MEENLKDWISLAVQAGGAISVCAMFIYHLNQNRVAADVKDNKFLDHINSKDERSVEQSDKHMAYLGVRDTQSIDIAKAGHAALDKVAQEVFLLRTKIENR